MAVLQISHAVADGRGTAAICRALFGVVPPQHGAGGDEPVSGGYRRRGGERPPWVWPGCRCRLPRWSGWACDHLPNTGRPSVEHIRKRLGWWVFRPPNSIGRPDPGERCG